MAHALKLTASQFRKRFQTEADCKNYLYTVRWPKGFVCPKCGCREFSFYKCRNGIFQCKKCRHQTSLTAGTVMHRTHLPMLTWFWAIYLVATDKRGISAVQLSRQLEITYESAWYLLKRIRKAMAARDKDYILSGIVEMDTFYFGGKDKNGAHGGSAGKDAVMIAVSKRTGKKTGPLYLRIVAYDTIDNKTVGDFVNRYIQKGSTVQTDAAASFRKPLAADYNHEYEKYTRKESPLPGLHLAISLCKRVLRGTYQGNCRHDIQQFLDEFCFRYNRRFEPQEMFSRLLRAVVA
ncbi:MAG: IS1595 family transposase [Faecalibacterium sp.]|nr:IS1595 family transposase [Faecalibacterium sp.]